MKKISLFISAIFCVVFVFAKQPAIYPTHWWVGMKNPKLQLMIHAPDIGKETNNVIVKYPGITLESVNKVEGSNYLFINLSIAPRTKPGTVVLRFIKQGEPLTINYELKKRRPGNGTAFAQGVTSADFIYLLMPDRFSNGDESNDHIAGMLDQTLNRDSMYHRHGGDLQGVINHLDYLQQLGVTAVWMTPVLENDMPNRTEHGYAFTDHYKIDPRFGG